MEQETIEEPDYNKIIQQSLVELRKQPMSFVPNKRMYSEEEVRLMLAESFKASQEGYNITSDEIIEQFKKN
jgi:hypothetical protein